MIFLLAASGVVSLVFGLMLIFLPDSFWEREENILNKFVFSVEGKLGFQAIIVGGIFLVLGGWFFLIGGKYAELSYFKLGAIVTAIFGLLYGLAPVWLFMISKISGKDILNLDRIALASRKTFGVFFVLAAIYIFAMLPACLK